MKQERFPKSMRPLMSGAVTAGLAVAVTSLPAGVQAQQANAGDDANGNATEGDATALKKITLKSGGGEGNSGNANHATTGIARMPATVKETPKIINVVSKDLIEQQRASTLADVLKNVPGITLSTGEGRGGQNGDQFRIRGLSSKGDIYTDGLRDFGAYNRDAFNTESVEVIKGPSGSAFGVGNVGGLINQSSKKARLGTSTDIDQSVMSGPGYRTTLDSNIQINDTSAVRINGMFQNRDVADRDHAFDDRRGAAIDLGLGLGTDTQWHLNYSYQHNDGVPDYGVPMAQGADGIYRPLLEYGVPGYSSSTSYIRSTDRDISNTHMVTSNFSKELENGIVINNDTRVSIYDRDFSSTNPADVSYADLQTLLGGGNVPLGYGAGGGMTYKQDGWAIQNVLSAKGEFHTGDFRHQAMIGIDANIQRDERDTGTWTGRPSDQMVINPRHDYSGATVAYGVETKSSASNVGLFASDRVWFNDQFSLLGNLRWDYFHSKYRTDAWGGVPEGSADSRELSPAISAIWEPNQDMMFYASFARTYRPIGTDIAFTVSNLDSVRGNMDNHPERSDTYEVGGKIDLLDGKLGLTGALFQVDKTNSYAVDPITGNITPGFTDAGEGRRIRGVELGLTGNITDEWSATVAYAYLDSKITETSAANVANIGNDVQGVSPHNLTVWTAYEVPETVTDMQGKITFGGGFQYASSYFADSANTAKIPETFSLDAMVGYKLDKFRVSLNAYNLTDHQNYSSSFNTSRVVPASGRTFTINIGTTF